MNNKQLAEMIKRIRQEKLDEIVVNPNDDTPAGRAARKAMKDNQGKPALPLQAGQRLSPIGDKSRGRVVKTTNRFVPKSPVSAPLDAGRDIALDNPTTQSNMALAQNPNIGGAGGGNYSAAQTRIPMTQKRAAAGDFLPAKPNTDRQNNDLNAMRVAGRDTNQARPTSANYNSRSGPSFEKTGRGNAPSVSSAKPNVQPNLKPANVMSANPSFEFSDKQREAAKKGKVGIKDVQAWAQSRGIKADPSSKEVLRNYLNAAQNKTMKTDVKAGGTAATPTQTAAQSAELKMKAGMAQRSGPSVPAKPTPSATPNVQPARNSTLAAPSAMANRPNVQPARNSTLAAPSAMAAAPRVDARKQGLGPIISTNAARERSNFAGPPTRTPNALQNLSRK